jgi:large subunit ribosomal protein L24
LALIGADLQAALPSSARAPLSGQFSLQLEAKGTGRSPAALIGALEGAGTIAVEDAQVAGLDAKAFDTVTRAADQGLSLDAAHIREVTERALDSGRLSLPRAEGAYTITAGQLRLRSMIAPGDRADLGLSAGIDLSQWLLDARVTLVGADATSVPAAGRPEVYVGLKGPVMTPKRSVDVSALTGWLTLRAVDVQAKRLESVEAERRAALEAASRVAAEAERRTAAEAAARAAAEAQRRAAAEAAARAAAPPARVEPGPPADMPDPPAAPPRRAPPVSEQAPPLPPPIDIRPLPGARRSDLRRPLARAAARPNATGLRPAVAVPLRRVWPATQPQRG